MDQRPAESVLVIADGGVPALVACALCGAGASITMWAPPEGMPAQDLHEGAMNRERADAVRRQASELGYAFVRSEAAAVDGSREELVPLLLRRALHEARGRGIWIVVYPCLEGGKPTRVFHAEEAARLARNQAQAASESVDGVWKNPQRTLQLLLPIVDLTVEEVADLAVDLDVQVIDPWWAGEKVGKDADDARWVWESAMDASIRRLERVFRTAERG